LHDYSVFSDQLLDDLKPDELAGHS
jgi:hypothetical protein